VIGVGDLRLPPNGLHCIVAKQAAGGRVSETTECMRHDALQQKTARNERKQMQN
jgi:hypothetical protein